MLDMLGSKGIYKTFKPGIYFMFREINGTAFFMLPNSCLPSSGFETFASVFVILPVLFLFSP